MNRETMYRFLQACLTGRKDYATEDGVTFYRNFETDPPHLTLVLDALIDRYLTNPERVTRVAVLDLARSTDVRPDEVVRAVIALSHITLVSNHVEEKLIRIIQVDIDDGGMMSILIGLNGWLTYHLRALCETARQPHLSTRDRREAERIG